MKDVVDAVAAHKGEMTTLTDQLASATPSGVETVVSKIRAAIVLFENEIAAIFERLSGESAKPKAPPSNVGDMPTQPATARDLTELEKNGMLPSQQPTQVQPGE